MIFIDWTQTTIKIIIKKFQNSFSLNIVSLILTRQDSEISFMIFIITGWSWTAINEVWWDGNDWEPQLSTSMDSMSHTVWDSFYKVYYLSEFPELLVGKCLFQDLIAIKLGNRPTTCLYHLTWNNKIKQIE